MSILDLFRLLCFDAIVRHEKLNKDEIFILWSIFKNLDTHSINDLSSFRTQSGKLINQHRAGIISPDYGKNHELDMGYHFKEFEEYKETFSVRVFGTIKGNFKGGFTHLKHGELPRQFEQILEMME